MYEKDIWFLLFNAVMMNAFCMVYPGKSFELLSHVNAPIYKVNIRRRPYAVVSQ